MAGRFEFDSQHKILLLVMEGDVGDDDIVSANDRIAQQVNHLHPRGGISDLSGISGFDVSSKAMRMAAAQRAPYPEETAWFIVAAQDHIFGMARMYEMAGSRDNLKVVRSRQEALAALGVEKPMFEPVGSF
jgi:hypothetical protein